MASGKDVMKCTDDSVTITFEDQKNINKFANLSARLDDIKDELKVKQNDMKSLEEACDEICLMDEDDGKIPYLIGDLFINQSVKDTMKRLEDAKLEKTNEIKELEEQSEAIKSQMSNLKLYLYGKFANKINLETEED